MTFEASEAPPVEPGEELAQLLVIWNDRLIEEANSATTRAFNLGCFVGLLPASIIVLLTYLLTSFSWVGALTMAILMVLGLILFANVVAGYAHNNTSKRIYLREIEPEIRRTLTKLNLDQADLHSAARSALSQDALLYGYIVPETPEAPEEPGNA